MPLPAAIAAAPVVYEGGRRIVRALEGGRNVFIQPGADPAQAAQQIATWTDPRGFYADVSRMSPDQFNAIYAALQGINPQRAAELQAARTTFMSSPEGLKAQATWTTAALMGGGMGLTPQAQAEMERNYALVSAEIRNRYRGEQQGIESDLLRRGLLRSSLYGQERAGLSQGMISSLGQARIGAENQAMANQMGQIGMGLGQYQSAQELELERRRQRREERNQNIQTAVNIGQWAGGGAGG